MLTLALFSTVFCTGILIGSMVSKPKPRTAHFSPISTFQLELERAELRRKAEGAVEASPA